MGGADGQFPEKLAARRYLYALGQSLLGGEPTAARLQAADPALVADALSIMGVEDEFGLADALADAAGRAEELAPEYVRLFIGPERLAAPPWESVYRTRSRALFQRETLDVRNAYRVQGLLPEGYPRVADDHIALELGFLAALATRAQIAADEGRDADVRGALAASAQFIGEHLGAWADRYASDLADAAPGSLYARLACTCAALARADLAFAQAASGAGPAEAADLS